MRFATVSEGFVSRLSGRDTIAAGPRTAILPSGDLLCSFMLTSKLGTNDFLPVLYRSRDLGQTWAEQGAIWPHLKERWSMFTSISGDAAGGAASATPQAAQRLFLFGSRSPIDKPGETFWSDATQGIKQNELIWADSTDGGRTWSEPHVIPMPIPGSAEAPGALCITRRGRWLAPYSPYATFDPNLRVDRNQVVAVYSDDRGRSWKHSSMLRFAEPDSSAAEAWLVELSDGRLLGAGWHLNQAKGPDFPNAYALSHDGGATWTTTRSTGIMGQSTALGPLPDQRAVFIYNQRRHGEPGVWLAVVKPTDTDFGIEANEIVWRSETRTQHGSSGEHAEWGDFSFGEPSITPLPDGTLLVTLWCVQPSGSGIRYVKLKDLNQRA